MTVKEFINKHNIKLSDAVFALCNEGTELMRQGNALHNAAHVFRLLDNLDMLLTEEKDLDKSRINPEVLLLSICWHDVWRARLNVHNIFAWFIQLVWEGIGSSLVFKKKAFVISQDLIKGVSYAIRKHSDLQLLPRKTLESRILADIDNLDAWSLERLKSLKKVYLQPNNLNPAVLRFAKFYFNHIALRATEKNFYFEWSKTEFKKWKGAYKIEVEKLVKEYGYLLGPQGQALQTPQQRPPH